MTPSSTRTYPTHIDRRVWLTGSAAALATLAWPSSAQPAYPSRALKIVVPFPAGGPVDTVGRAVAQQLSQAWGKRVVVDNRASAGGIVGAEITQWVRVVRAADIKLSCVA